LSCVHRLVPMSTTTGAGALRRRQTRSGAGNEAAPPEAPPHVYLSPPAPVFNVPVTRANAALGMLVTRGLDWKWECQDGASGAPRPLAPRFSPRLLPPCAAARVLALARRAARAARRSPPLLPAHARRFACRWPRLLRQRHLPARQRRERPMDPRLLVRQRPEQRVQARGRTLPPPPLADTPRPTQVRPPRQVRPPLRAARRPGARRGARAAAGAPRPACAPRAGRARRRGRRSRRRPRCPGHRHLRGGHRAGCGRAAPPRLLGRRSRFGRGALRRHRPLGRGAQRGDAHVPAVLAQPAAALGGGRPAAADDEPPPGAHPRGAAGRRAPRPPRAPRGAPLPPRRQPRAAGRVRHRPGLGRSLRALAHRRPAPPGLGGGQLGALARRCARGHRFGVPLRRGRRVRTDPRGRAAAAGDAQQRERPA